MDQQLSGSIYAVVSAIRSVVIVVAISEDGIVPVLEDMTAIVVKGRNLDLDLLAIAGGAL